MTARKARRSPAPLLLLGMSLARRGIMPVASIVIVIGTAIVGAVLAAIFAARGESSPAHDIPLLAASALAWGGGFLLAFATAANGLHRDRSDGIRALFVARTTSLQGYLLGRIGGLAALIAVLVAGGTLLSGLAAVVAASRAGAVPKILQSTLAGMVFAVAFSVVVAPVAFAALGARSRVGGYLFLIGVVVIPELVAVVLGSSLPESVTDVLSIPSALAALRGSLSPGTVDLHRMVRALVAIACFVAIAMFLVRRDALRVEGQEVDA